MDNNELLEPLRLYQSLLKDKHHENVLACFNELDKKANINVEENGITCKKLYKAQEDLAKASKKLKSLGGLKAFLIILIVVGVIGAIVGGVLISQSNNIGIALLIGGIFLIVLSIILLSTTYKQKKIALTELVKKGTEAVEKYTNEATKQMQPLNSLFDSSLAADLFSKTCPAIEMDRLFEVDRYNQLVQDFEFWDNSDQSTSTVNVQSGCILGNPFVVMKDMMVTMVPHVYVGTRVITYTEWNGKETHTVTTTIEATFTAPEPHYLTETYLVYANEGAKKLSFSREPSKISSMSDDEIRKYVRKHEKELDKIAAKQMKKGGTYTPIGNSEFELFFGGLDRDNEVEFRLLFTALGQKAMMDLLKSKVGYGDDFSFRKVKGLNIIKSNHSQGSTLFLDTKDFVGLDYQIVKDKFVKLNDEYFKALFFDFAPILTIPLYSQFKTKEYKGKEGIKSNYSPFEHEVCANKFNPYEFAHKATKSGVILKTKFVKKDGKTDIVNVVAHSYDRVSRIATVPVVGPDRKTYMVEVPYFEYKPLTNERTIEVQDTKTNNEAKFNSIKHDGVVYAKGLISGIGEKLNVDILKKLAK